MPADSIADFPPPSPDHSLPSSQQAPPPRSPGRPIRFDDQRQATFCALVARGWSRRRAALSVGISPSTVRKFAQREPAFLERMLACEMQAELLPLKHVRAAMQRSWRAAAWMLERQKPHLYGRRDADGLSRQEFADAVRSSLEFAAELMENEADRDRLLGEFDRFLHAKGLTPTGVPEWGTSERG